MTLDLAIISWIRTKGTGNKRKIDKLDFIKFFKNCASDDTIRIKRQPTEWEKIFVCFNI